MNRRGLMIATLTALWCVPLIGARDDGSRVPRRESPNAYGYEVIATGRVRHVHAPRLFTVERRETPDQPLLVFVPYADATPIEGTVVTTGGRLRRFEDAQVEETDDWSQLDAAARESFVSGPVLVATSLVTSTGRQLARRAPRSQAAAGLLSQEPRRQGERRDEWPIPVLPGMVGDNVVTLAGHAVRVANARVVGVFNSHAFLIETQASLRPLLGNRSRVVVFIDKRALNVAPETLVAESVTVSGIVRTLLGMHVSREVAWPPALTREAVERLEIRAALLATAVQTPEGIDLTAAGE
jgi:hypothetical protein